jgi:hypothetical protein
MDLQEETVSGLAPEKKLRSRFCVRGDQQVEGVDYFESYAPVVQWSTVRVVFIMVIIYGLISRQVDFQNAFCQSTLGEHEHVYVEIPKGFDAPPGAPPDATLYSSSGRSCTD